MAKLNKFRNRRRERAATRMEIAEKGWLLAEWKDKKLLLGFSAPTIILGMIIVLAAGLRFYNFSAIGDANIYYLAAVKSMLQSWHNFFFVAAEPGGSVSVDKPPLGLWIQALSALIFGVNSFAVVLPQILAGLISIALLYRLVEKYFGPTAGLIAAFIQATAPAAIAVERNNTMDALLILTLLGATWAFIKTTESNNLRWLMLGSVLIGIGFNIKMLQAFMPLPAFYALYLFGAQIGWKRKIINLGLATVVLLLVSLSWALVVDLTPVDKRPYVGSSQNNSEFDLIIGYNGINRLISDSFTGLQHGLPNQNANPSEELEQPESFHFEIGTRGALRLFIPPLGSEIGWLLPFGLLSIALLTFRFRPTLPLPMRLQALILWGGWLITEFVFFSAAGFFHAYYMAMLAPPLAALVAIGITSFWNWRDKRPYLSVIFIIGVAGTLAFQIWLANRYGLAFWWFIPCLALLIIGISFVIISIVQPLNRYAVASFLCLTAALLVIPTLWAGLTTLNDDINSILPRAYTGTWGIDKRGNDQAPTKRSQGNLSDVSNIINEDMLQYLVANTQDVTYLMAVSAATDGDPYIIMTGRPVLLMGGFTGYDQVVDADDLARFVEEGKLRYVFARGGLEVSGENDISEWLRRSCVIIPKYSMGGMGEPSPYGNTLYQCSLPN